MFSRKLSAAGSQSAAPDLERIKSRLLPMLFENLEEPPGRGRLVVLDVGSGSQSTVELFARYNARIYFVNLLSNEECSTPAEDMDAESARESFARHLAVPDDVTFDICLFWDVLHRFPPTVLQGLSRALAPHLGAQTLGYGFGTLHGQMLQTCRYGVEDENHLLVRPVADGQPFQAHSQQQLSEHFTSLDIRRSTLLQEGRLELLFGKA